MKKRLFILLALALTAAFALACADTLSMDGTVEASETYEVYAPIGGTVSRVVAKVGQEVAAGDVICELRTTKVYAEEDGTVTGIFGEPGDSADTVDTRYGGVLYIEGTSAYEISATTENAYNSASAKFVHVGETVYVRCKSNTSRSGVGRITAIDGTSFTVDIDEGTFIPDDAVELYRDKNYSSTKHIGSGTAARKNPTAVTAEGSIVSIAVTDGQEVKKGDLLLEMLTGTFDGLEMTGAAITAGQDGIVYSLSVSQGTAIEKDDVAAVLYSRDAMRITAEVPEDSLYEIAAGDKVHIELAADESRQYEGTVEMISGVATSSDSDSDSDSSSEVTYTAKISFTPDDAVRYGMSVIVDTYEKTDEDAAETVSAADEESEAEKNDGEESEAEEDIAEQSAS